MFSNIDLKRKLANCSLTHYKYSIVLDKSTNSHLFSLLVGVNRWLKTPPTEQTVTRYNLRGGFFKNSVIFFPSSQIKSANQGSFALPHPLLPQYMPWSCVFGWEFSLSIGREAMKLFSNETKDWSVRLLAKSTSEMC